VWWPSPSDYQDTVQNPRVAFSDPVLRDGTVVRDALGLPKPISGSFATVYQVDHAGRRYAVRCFLRHVPDIAQRYAAISAYLKQVSLPYTVEFNFLSQGIRLRGQWFPILKMDWLEGERLDVYVARHLNDSNALLELTRQFIEMALALRQAKMAHGDLQHGNLLVVKNQLRLLDYDGMFVPALAGRGSNEVGQPNYQHPIRSARDYGPNLDNFSVWVIALSLLGLAIEPSLRTAFNRGGEALLLERSDFINPSASKTLTTLQTSSNPTLRYLTLTFVPYLFARDLDSIPALEPNALGRLQSQTIVLPPQTLPDWLRDSVPPATATAPNSAPAPAGMPPPGADWLLDHMEEASPQALSGSFRAEKSLLTVVGLLFVLLVGVMLVGPVPPLIGAAILAALPLIAVLSLSLFFSLRYNSPERRDAARLVQELQNATVELRRRESVLMHDVSGMARAEQEEMAKLMAQQSANTNKEKTGLAALDQTLSGDLAKIDARRQELDDKKDALFEKSLKQLQQEQLERKLETYRISDAILPGIINRELKQTLERHGFHSAADITNFKVNFFNSSKRFNLINRKGVSVYVEGVTPERGVALILWRRTVEARVKGTLPTTLPTDTLNKLNKRFQDEIVNLKLAELKTKQQVQDSKAQLTESARKEHERLTRAMQELPAIYKNKLQATEQELAQVRRAIAEREWALVLARRRLQSFAHINFLNYVKSIFGLE
jgi:hypothetical protein